jgi:S1-C subfamily serine protease
MKKLLKIIKISTIIILSCFIIYSVYSEIKYIDNLNKKIDLCFDLITSQYDLISDGNNAVKNQLLDEIIKIKKEIQKELNQINKNIEETKSDIDIKRLINCNITVLGKEGLGSGTIIKKTESYMLVISCYHIIADILESKDEDNDKHYFVAYTNMEDQGNERYNLGSRIYEATLIKYDKEEDMILLKINVNDSNLDVMKIATEYPKIGDTIYTIGNPLLMERTVSKGILSNILDGFYVTDGTITFGNSGGSLINKYGELIGIPDKVTGYNVLLGVVPESGLGMSITLNKIEKFLEDTEMNDTAPLKLTIDEINKFFKDLNNKD